MELDQSIFVCGWCFSRVPPATVDIHRWIIWLIWNGNHRTNMPGKKQKAYIPFLECLRRSTRFSIPIRPNIFLAQHVWVCLSILVFTPVSRKKGDKREEHEYTQKEKGYTQTDTHTHTLPERECESVRETESESKIKASPWKRIINVHIKSIFIRNVTKILHLETCGPTFCHSLGFIIVELPPLAVLLLFVSPPHLTCLNFDSTLVPLVVNFTWKWEKWR